MPNHDHLEREFDAFVGELTEEYLERFEAGRGVAKSEILALGRLAAAIARSLGEWRALLGNVEMARSFDMRRAGRLIIESVFDEVLAPSPWRLLSAAFAATEVAP